MGSLPSPRHPDASAVVLAGGLATRLGGAAKAFLDLGGEAILDRQIAVLRPLFSEIVVAVGAPVGDSPVAMSTRLPFLSRGLRILEDVYPGAGPLAGLHVALRASRTPWIFAVACDMPFLDGDLIARLAALAVAADRTDALVPLRGGRPEPLHAFYHAAIAGEAEACLAGGRRAMTDLLGAVRTRFLEDADLPGLSQSYAWTNLNTPEDLEAAALAIERTANGSRRGRG